MAEFHSHRFADGVSVCDKSFSLSIASSPAGSLDLHEAQSKRTLKRPDQALYIPRARRLQQKEELSNVQPKCSAMADIKHNKNLEEAQNQDNRTYETSNITGFSVESVPKRHDNEVMPPTLQSIPISVEKITLCDNTYNIQESNTETVTDLPGANLSSVMLHARCIHRTDEKDSWEMMFNDEGECLNPEVLQNLTPTKKNLREYSGNVGIRDYQGSEAELHHIVELYDFPIEFSTQDLVSAFTFMKSEHFSIRWVDDTHALGIFSSPYLAVQALELNHPFIKTRPLSQGIRESQLKAKKCSEPPKPRPATSVALARRLVTGALGVRVNISKEQIIKEKQTIQNAKEKRKRVAKNRQNIWDGVISDE